MDSNISISIVIVGGHLATSFSYANRNSLLERGWWEMCQGGWGKVGGGGGRGWRRWGVAPFLRFFGFFRFFKSRLLTGAMNSKISISIVIVGGYLATSFSYWNRNSLLERGWCEVCQEGSRRSIPVLELQFPCVIVGGYLATSFSYWNRDSLLERGWWEVCQEGSRCNSNTGMLRRDFSWHTSHQFLSNRELRFQ